MEKLLQEIQNTFKEALPEKKFAHARIKQHPLSRAESLTNLIKKFPCTKEIASAANTNH